MTISFHPKSLAVTVAFLVAFGSALSVATDLRHGVAVGVVAVLAYLLVEVVIAFNPVVWWRGRPGRRT